MLVRVLLSVLIAVASLSVILQVCILRTLTDIASNPMRSVGSATPDAFGSFSRESIPVTITNSTLDVNVENPVRDMNVTVTNPTLDVNVKNSTLDVKVENSELDVNVQNTELDVRMRDHWIVEGDPIPVTIVK